MARIAEAIDLTLPEKDHLAALPPELLHMIISYLFPTHRPDTAFEERLRGEDRMRSQHPLDFLAATCKTLRAEVHDWADTFRRQHRDIMESQASAARLKGKPRRNWLRGRGGLLWWAERNCVFCGKLTKRAAIFMNGLHCCKECDDLQWPNKITKTAAFHEFHLTAHHLLPHKQHTPMPAKGFASFPVGFPRLRYGTLVCASVQTTLFLRKDVEALARAVHSDLEAHLAMRKVEKEERSRKLKATKAKKLERAQQRVQEVIEVEGLTRRCDRRGRTYHVEEEDYRDWPSFFLAFLLLGLLLQRWSTIYNDKSLIDYNSIAMPVLEMSLPPIIRTLSLFSNIDTTAWIRCSSITRLLQAWLLRVCTPAESGFTLLLVLPKRNKIEDIAGKATLLKDTFFP